MLDIRSLNRFRALVLAGLVLTATPAFAQFQARPVESLPLGEQYHFEGAAGFWSPDADMEISSEGLDIIGSRIDFKKDLGLTDQRFGELHAVGKLARKHKLRFQYIPISYSQETTIARDIIFNGQRYRTGLPVISTLDWKAFRYTYEYDFVARGWGFAGVLFDLKHTVVDASLDNPVTSLEKWHIQGPVPSLGGIVRYYFVPQASITGEMSGMLLPASISDQYNGHFADLDIYGTVNVNRNFGAQFGYRSFDVGATVERDWGSFVLKGIYFGAVFRY